MPTADNTQKRQPKRQYERSLHAFTLFGSGKWQAVESHFIRIGVCKKGIERQGLGKFKSGLLSLAPSARHATALEEQPGQAPATRQLVAPLKDVVNFDNLSRSPVEVA